MKRKKKTQQIGNKKSARKCFTGNNNNDKQNNNNKETQGMQWMQQRLRLRMLLSLGLRILPSLPLLMLLS